MNSELYFLGKKFISAKRASEISGYTADYIGQLCRLKKLEYRRIGRSWFVSENSLLEHKKNSSLKATILSSLPVDVLPVSEKPIQKPPLKPSTQILPSSYFSPASIFDPKPKQEIFYVSAKRASEISGYTPDYVGQLCRSNQLDCKQVGKRWFISEVSLRQHKDDAAKKERGVIYFPPAVLPKAEAKKEFASLAPFASKKIFRSRFKKSFLITSAVSLAVITLVFFGASFNKNLHLIERSVEVSSTENSASVGSASVGSAFLGSVGKFFNQLASGVYYFVASLFNFGTTNTLVVRDSEHADALPQKTGQQMGITVVPSSGDDAKDEKTKQQIKDSFSDQTEVFPDKSGTSGVIKPVFTKMSDQNYLYVMVPVNEQLTR